MKQAARKRILVLVSLLAVVGALAAFGGYRSEAEPRDVRTVRLAYLPTTHALPLFAEKEMESPDGPVRIELIKYGSWPELMDALNTGRVDGASVLIELPQIATGLHLALGTAWVFLVAGEMVGAQSGLGFLIIDARNNLRADLLMAAILMIGLLGLLLDSAMSLAERQLYRAWGIRGGKS